MSRHLHLDFETYCEVDLTKVGADVYFKHPSFEVLMCAWAIDDGPVRLVDYSVPESKGWLPPEVHDPDILIHAYRASFERGVLRHGFKLGLPLSRFRCTMYHIWHLGFSGKMEEVGAQMGLAPDQQKMAEGKQLIQKFSKPPGENVKRVDRYTRETDPEDWNLFCQYCIQDVITEREIDLFARRYPLPESEQQLWELDQRINQRGLPVDEVLVDAALTVFEDEKRDLKARLKAITGLKNPNSRPQLLGWLHRNGYQLPDLKAETIETWLKNNVYDEAETVVKVLKLRQQSARTAGTKWKAFKEYTDWITERLRNAFEAYGAQRTGRWAGRGPQPHNLHSSPEDQDLKVRALLTRDVRMIKLLGYDNVMDVVASCVRAAITAGHDRRLAVADYHSIENVVLGYLSGCEYINRINGKGLDPYKDFATHVYHKPYDQVTKAERKFCKPPVLGCGYQLSGNTLVEYAAQYGVELTRQESFHLVRIWRGLCHEVPAMWRWLIETTRDVIENNTQHQGYGVSIWRDPDFLFITLLSGRSLAYYRPLVEEKAIPWTNEAGEETEFITRSMTYMGRNTRNHQWERLSTHGGKLTENIVQALSRDVLKHGLTRAEEQKLTVVGHVHDEIICEEPTTMKLVRGFGEELLSEEVYLEDKKHIETFPEAEKALETLIGVMSEPIPWAPGLKITAEGYVAERYRKE